MKKKKFGFKYLVNVRWSVEDDAYIAEVPELPGCATHGATYEIAIRHAQDAIASWISGAKQSGYPIPEPVAERKFSGNFVTRVPPALHRALVIKAKESGKTLNKFIQELLESGVTFGARVATPG